eukprot:g14348.t1
MDPPRRPESGWLPSAGGSSKNQPTLAPTPDPSQITRAAPLPADLVARNGGDPENQEAKRAEQGKKAAEEQEDEQEEELCAICYDQLPDVGRGIIACGHVFCFACIHQWCKSQNDCPGCRFKVKRILKTLSPEDSLKEKERKELLLSKKIKNKKKRGQARRRATRVQTHKTSIVTKTVRIRPASLRPTPAQQRAEPHPEAPGGWMYAEAQEAARQRLVQQQQQQQQQQQPQRIQPVHAQGVLAEMAESMRIAEESELSRGGERPSPGGSRASAVTHPSRSGPA